MDQPPAGFVALGHAGSEHYAGSDRYSGTRAGATLSAVAYLRILPSGAI